MVKPFFWNPDKNTLLKQERGLGFEDIVEAIDSGCLLDDAPHPSAHYPGQRLYFVHLDGSVIVVPYVEEDEYIFLKTAFPSRKAKQKYFGEE